MTDRKVDEKKKYGLKKNFNLYLDNRREIMNSTQFKVENEIVDIINKASISPGQNTELNNFFAKLLRL